MPCTITVLPKSRPILAGEPMLGPESPVRNPDADRIVRELEVVARRPVKS